jgi:hypothetical protein
MASLKTPPAKAADNSLMLALDSDRSERGDRRLDNESPPMSASSLRLGPEALLPDSPTLAPSAAEFPDPDEMMFFDVGVVVAKSKRVPYHPLKMPSLQDVLVGAAEEDGVFIDGGIAAAGKGAGTPAFPRRTSISGAAPRRVSFADGVGAEAAASAHAAAGRGEIGGDYVEEYEAGEDSAAPLYGDIEPDASVPELAAIMAGTAGSTDEAAVAELVDRVCATLCSEERLQAHHDGGDAGTGPSSAVPPPVVAVFAGRLSDPATMHAVSCSLQLLALQQFEEGGGGGRSEAGAAAAADAAPTSSGTAAAAEGSRTTCQMRVVEAGGIVMLSQVRGRGGGGGRWAR